MTMKVEEFKTTVKRKQHPNASRYPCRACHEILDAGRRLLDSLSFEDLNLLRNNELVLDEEETAELFDSFKVEDIIGLGVLRKDGFKSNMYKILKIVKDEDWLECENALTKEVEEISFEDVSVGLALNLAEILYRDDKPYGVSEDIEYTIRIHKEDEENENTTEENTDTSAVAEKIKETDD